jgi:hypothetical protein
VPVGEYIAPVRRCSFWNTGRQFKVAELARRPLCFIAWPSGMCHQPRPSTHPRNRHRRFIDASCISRCHRAAGARFASRRTRRSGVDILRQDAEILLQVREQIDKSLRICPHADQGVAGGVLHFRIEIRDIPDGSARLSPCRSSAELCEAENKRRCDKPVVDDMVAQAIRDLGAGILGG